MFKQFNLNEEVIKIAAAYLVPMLIGAIASLVGPVADFAWAEVLFTWRGLVVLASLIVGLLVAPYLSVWMAFLVFTVLLLQRLSIYRNGPRFRKTGYVPLLFSGFYEITDSGELRRTGKSAIVEAKFLKILNHLLGDHRLQEAIPLRVVSFKPPRVIHSRCSYETFEKLMWRYASNSLAVVWGVIDGEGRIRRFEVASSKQHYAGGEKALKTNDDLALVCEMHSVHPDRVVEFLATAYAALWGHCFCGLLNLNGKWQTSYAVAGNSRRLFEKALLDLSAANAGAESPILEVQRRQVLPLFMTEEAIALHEGKQWEDAIEKLVDVLKTNPLWPCYDTNEFADFYTYRYAWEVYSHCDPNAATTPPNVTAERVSRRAWLTIAPNLQYLKQWIDDGAESIDDLPKKIDRWFEPILGSHPDNAFVLMYWVDSLKIPEFARWRTRGEEGALRLQTLDHCIEICRRAYDMMPLPVIATRLAGLYMTSLGYFKENEPEHKRRLNQMRNYIRPMKLFLHETLPEAMEPNDGGNTRAQSA